MNPSLFARTNTSEGITLNASLVAQQPEPLADLAKTARGSLYYFRAAQAIAFLNDRDYVIPDDVKGLAIPLLAHRILLKSSTRNCNRS